MKCFRLVRSVLVVSLVCLVGTVRADLVPNGDFTTDVSGWSWTGGTWAVTWVDVTGADPSPDGPCAQIDGANWLYQPGCTTPPAFVAGKTYEFSFLAALLGGNSATLTANIQPGSLVASGTSYGMEVTPTSVWQEYSLTFTAVAGDVGQPFQPAFLGAANVYFGIDSVRLDAIPAPEPSTLVLLGMGLLGLSAYAWRKRR